MTTQSIKTAQSYRLHRDGIDLDGQPFPWHVLADGPKVQAMEGVEDMHILWLPIIVEAILPSEVTA